MKERTAKVRVLPQTITEVEANFGVPFSEWFADQVALVEEMRLGRIYQKVGNDYLRLSINDIHPYNELLSMVPEGAVYDAFVVKRRNVSKSIGDEENLKKWVLKVINFGLIVPQLSLFFWDGEEYSPIVYSSDDKNL